MKQKFCPKVRLYNLKLLEVFYYKIPEYMWFVSKLFNENGMVEVTPILDNEQLVYWHEELSREQLVHRSEIYTTVIF